MKWIRFVRAIHFSASHSYHSSELNLSENREAFGELASKTAFGYNFRLEASFEGEVDSMTGMIVNLSVVDGWLKQLHATLDHRHLNDSNEFFQTHTPTAENVAVYCFNFITDTMEKDKASSKGVKLKNVRLYEGENFWIDYPV